MSGKITKSELSNGLKAEIESKVKQDDLVPFQESVVQVQNDLDEHKADNATIKHKAREIALQDGTNLEVEVGNLKSSVSDGKALVGSAITGVDDSVVIPTEPSFGDLAGAISGISTGRKWASGLVQSSSGSVTVDGLDFKPGIVICKSKNSQTNSYGNLAYTSYFISKESIGSDYDISFYTNNRDVASHNASTISLNGFSMRVHIENPYLWIAFE